MSIKDSIYTSPDALRAKYLQPKNVLQNIEEATAQAESAILQSTTIQIVGGNEFGSVGGSFGGGIGYGGGSVREQFNDNPEIGGLTS